MPQASGIVIGSGFRFGHKAAGNTDTLCELGKKYALDIHVADLVSSNAPGLNGKVRRSSFPAPSGANQLLWTYSIFSLSCLCADNLNDNSCLPVTNQCY